MNKLLEEIRKIGIVPVVTLDNSDNALPLAVALNKGGIDCIEITFRTKAAKKSIMSISREFPKMLIGAGTVLTTQHVDEAIYAGAKFIVTPGLNPKIVKYCIEKNITIIPGCSSPTDIEIAIELGVNTVKIFPVENIGGLNMIKALSAPYTNMNFIPTGGINLKNINSYLSFKKVIACGGSWITNKELIDKNDFNSITKLSKEAISSILNFELAHVCMNSKDESHVNEIANLFTNIFNFENKKTLSSTFVSNNIEIMGPPYNRGTNGHLAIATNSVERAVYHLIKTDVSFDYKTAKYDTNNTLKFIYLKNEINGFAVHLLQKN
ncbi:MAG: bifunctional 4-hydroxy-2-oxoglutarate aldolase/2-dehydro-3-deoxy-phosphogluconate aldolase [Endomicrobium sp.]|jgi:2-dehydro-3-deoxyphosphogluconate aldolase/(4S)-4-hydroxy-2-oxoglutarate aldolase|nr:bifunctional 4-hydroxy-2-oxoglutarate aldolase/2-dehydro-3-deoxy-phosphogluconate aldolase [Endomicrobium sp.]